MEWYYGVIFGMSILWISVLGALLTLVAPLNCHLAITL